MPWTLDARLPVVIVRDEAGLAAALNDGPKAAVLMEAPPEPMPEKASALASFEPLAPGHAGGCACCGGGRSPAAAALDRLFQARVRGACPWFERVVAVAETRAARDAVMAALRDDAVTAARFRAA
jgi:hypothetical protein